MDSGLDTMERNVLQAELRGDFSALGLNPTCKKGTVRRVGCSATPPWKKKRQLPGLENGMSQPWKPKAFRQMRSTSWLLNVTRQLRLWPSCKMPEGLSKRPDPDNMLWRCPGLQFYPTRPGASGSSGPTWKQLRKPDEAITVSGRCGGPHRVADCKEPPKAKPQAAVEDATFVFLAESDASAIAAMPGKTREAPWYLWSQRSWHGGQAHLWLWNVKPWAMRQHGCSGSPSWRETGGYEGPCLGQWQGQCTGASVHPVPEEVRGHHRLRFGHGCVSISWSFSSRAIGAHNSGSPSHAVDRRYF